jgi:hypothetical protein
MLRRFARPLLLALILVFVALSALAAPKYVASRERDPFHLTTCSWAAKISSANAVYYDTRDEALADNHRPCKVCKP